MQRRPYPDFVYHITSPDALERIRESGGLAPQGGAPGSYVVEPESFARSWARRTRFFGSPLQALLHGFFDRGHAELVLLKVTVDAEEDEISVRDLGPIFRAVDNKPYWERLVPYEEWRDREGSVAELIIRQKAGGRIPLERIEVMHRAPLAHFGGADRLRRERLEPGELLKRVLDPQPAPAERLRRGRPLFMGLEFRLLLLREAARRLLARLKPPRRPRTGGGR